MFIDPVRRKTAVVSFRLDESLFSKIDEIARSRKWSISQVVAEIVSTYFAEGVSDHVKA